MGTQVFVYARADINPLVDVPEHPAVSSPKTAVTTATETSLGMEITFLLDWDLGLGPIMWWSTLQCRRLRLKFAYRLAENATDLSAQ